MGKIRYLDIEKLFTIKIQTVLKEKLKTSFKHMAP